MEEELTDYDYFTNKRTDKIYLSRSIDTFFSYKDEMGDVKEMIRPIRIVSKIVENSEDHKFIKEGKEISLRITPGGKQEIKAKFYEDTRNIKTLTIQKYTTATGSPHNTYFTFQGDEILKLFNFIRNIAVLPISSKNSERIDETLLEEIILTKEQAVELINKNPDLIEEIFKNNISAFEIQELAYRKEQLELFRKMLEDDDFFNSRKQSFNKDIGDEYVWQDFFEKNTWIFGYGLDFIFNSPLEGEKLEQVVAGNTLNSSGKRVDALMKTRGLINSFCFGEIKTHKKKLLKQVPKPYRSECWAISDELAGAIAQVQKSVHKSFGGLTQVNSTDGIGNPTGETVFNYQPKSFIIIGDLKEFISNMGVNEEQFSSFELFRRNQINPEIITFDELYERAKFIVRNNEKEM